MFPTRYFADRYFAPRYFPKVGATPTPPTGQTPAGTRYRSGSRVNFIHQVILVCLSYWLS
jgi:hypothetical protein